MIYNKLSLRKKEPVKIEVFPTPQKIEERGSGFFLTPKIGIVVPEEYDQTVIDELKKMLKKYDVKNIQLFSESEYPTTPVTLYISNEPESAFITSQLITLDVNLEKFLSNEGYILTAGQAKDSCKKIVIAGADWNGTFYGVKTLNQIIQSHPGRASVPEIVIEDYPAMAIRGVIEGFYGNPWTQEERISQIEFYADNKMNTYIYAPKDDPYHRNYWRDPYPREDINKLSKLVSVAQDNHVKFVFTISPGLDICYSDDNEFGLLTDKAQAMWDLGVRDFALLLDDTFLEMNCEADEEMFGSAISPSASAQAHLLNKFQEEFIDTHDGANRLITVPTEYHQDGISPYREQFAELVDSSVLVFWTGIGITTETITNEDAEQTSNIFKHDLLIWDNFPTNDFARDRLFLGPLTGRDTRLSSHGVHGLTANPMEYSEASKIPLFTVADYTWNPTAYKPNKSWEAGIKKFAGSFAKEVTTFAENALSSPLNKEESPTLSPLIRSFWDAFDQGNIEREGDNLLLEFKKMETTADKLKNNFTNEAFLLEMNSWIDKMRHQGKAGQLAVKMILSQQDGDKELVTNFRKRLDAILLHDTTDITFEEEQRSSRDLDGFDQERDSGELVQYTSKYGDRTGTNEWGYEITVIDEKVTKVSGNNSVIPENGYVLSVHSSGDGDWLLNNSIVGAYVSIKNDVVNITIEKGKYDIPNLRTYAFNVFKHVFI